MGSLDWSNKRLVWFQMSDALWMASSDFLGESLLFGDSIALHPFVSSTRTKFSFSLERILHLFFLRPACKWPLGGGREWVAWFWYDISLKWLIKKHVPGFKTSNPGRVNVCNRESKQTNLPKQIQTTNPLHLIDLQENWSGGPFTAELWGPLLRVSFNALWK